LQEGRRKNRKGRALREEKGFQGRTLGNYLKVKGSSNEGSGGEEKSTEENKKNWGVGKKANGNEKPRSRLKDKINGGFTGGKVRWLGKKKGKTGEKGRALRDCEKWGLRESHVEKKGGRKKSTTLRGKGGQGQA